VAAQPKLVQSTIPQQMFLTSVPEYHNAITGPQEFTTREMPPHVKQELEIWQDHCEDKEMGKIDKKLAEVEKAISTLQNSVDRYHITLFNENGCWYKRYEYVGKPFTSCWLVKKSLGACYQTLHL